MAETRPARAARAHAAPEAGMPLVSAIMPAYNHARFVEASLDSIAAQTYPRMELVVIDDGSKDETPRLIEAWIQRNRGRFERTVFERQANQGVAATLGRLLQLSRGEYLAHLSSDDLMLPDSTQRLVDALRSAPRAYAVWGNASMVNDEGEALPGTTAHDMHHGWPRALEDPRWMRRELLLCWCIGGPGLVVRADPFRSGAVPFYRAGIRVEDREFHLRLLADDRLVHCSAIVGAYRVHAANQGRSDAAVRARNFEEQADVEESAAAKFRGLERLGLRAVARIHRIEGARARGRASLLRLATAAAWHRLLLEIHRVQVRLSRRPSSA